MRRVCKGEAPDVGQFGITGITTSYEACLAFHIQRTDRHPVEQYSNIYIIGLPDQNMIICLRHHAKSSLHSLIFYPRTANLIILECVGANLKDDSDTP